MNRSGLRLAVAGVAVAGAAVAAVPAQAVSSGHYDGGARPAAAAKPMPNEWTARQSVGGDSPGGTRVTSARGPVYGCNYLEFCTYANPDFTKMVDRVSSCTWHQSHAYFSAYVNYQTDGTRATFYDGGKHYMGKSTQARSRATTMYGKALYIVPC